MKKIAFVFPGQGSQKIGMGKELAASFTEVRALFDLAESVLGFPISQICFEGPEDQLVQTTHAQPGIFLISMALTHLL